MKECKCLKVTSPLPKHAFILGKYPGLFDQWDCYIVEIYIDLEHVYFGSLAVQVFVKHFKFEMHGML